MKIFLGKTNGPKIIMFKAAEDFNPLRTIDVEWNCCMAVGFNPQIQKTATQTTPPKKSPRMRG